MNDLNVALVLSLKDKLISPFQRTVRDAEREFDKLEKKAKETDKATANVASTMAKVGQAAPALGQAAQALGQVERGAQQAERNLSLLERTAARLRNTLHGLNSLQGVGGTLSKAAGNGVNGLDAFVALIDKMVSGDKRFQAAKTAAQNATGDDRQAAYQAQADLLQGSAIGKVVQDRQALMALVGLMNNRDYVADVKGKMANSDGTVNQDFSFMTEGAGFSYDQRNFEVQKAQTDALTQANSAITKLADAQTDLYRRYPGFAQAIEGSKVMLESFTAALAAFGAMNLLRGGAGGAAGAVGAAGMGGAARLAGQAAGLYAAWEVGQAAGGLISDKIEGTSVGDAVGSAVAHVAALWSTEARESIAAMERYDKARSDEAQALMQRMEAMSARPVELTLNGDKVAEHVGQSFSDLAKRH